jgi:hypothetical protein
VDETASLLALLHGARRSYTTLRMTVREWRDQERLHEAIERASRVTSSGGQHGYVGGSSGAYESELRLWIEPPDRARQEARTDASGDVYSSLLVVEGTRWSAYYPRSGAVTSGRGDGPRRSVGGAGLLDPTVLLVADRIEIVGRAVVAGRDGIRVRIANEPSVIERSVHGVPLQADTLEAVVDAERGVLLYRAALLDGEPYSTSEALEVAYDERFPPDTFVFVVPDGSRPRPARTPDAPPQRVAVGEAAAAVSFALLAPDRLPPGWQVDASVVERYGRTVVELAICGQDGADLVSVTERAATGRFPTSDRFDAVTYDGVSYLATRADDDEAWQRPGIVLFERDGTRVQLTSQALDSERLLALATRFRVV